MTSALATTRTLDQIADSIRDHWKATEDDRFAIGRDLMEARDQFPGNVEFGQWFKAQAFPFTTEWSRTLRLAAENEPAVRAAFATQVANGKTPNIKEAVKEVLHPVTSPPITYAPGAAPKAPKKEKPSQKAAEALGLLNAIAAIDTEAVIMSMSYTQHTRLRAAAKRAKPKVERLSLFVISTTV
jgi:hypothetical protein